MFPINRHWSRSKPASYLYQWLNSDRCVLCQRAITYRGCCDACRQDLPTWTRFNQPEVRNADSVTVGFRYEYPVDRLIQLGKYGGHYPLMASLGFLMPAPEHLSGDACLYPVPVSTITLLRRGFNQTSVLAYPICSAYKLSIDEVSIHKRCFLSDQSKLNAERRKANAGRLFSISTDKVARHCIIIDDVITTGATMSVIAGLLKQCGAERVDVIALAAVP